LVIEEDEKPSDGAVVVTLLRDGEEVTVKRRLYREGEMVRLKPQNGEHEDFVISAREVRIQGRVVHVIHPPG
jgi:repressor LexA